MISLKVSTNEARNVLGRVPHQTLQDAVSRNWNVDPDRTIDGRSVCWLYCWAKTGMGSQNAAEAAERAFDDLVDVSFDRFDAVVDHEWARRARYSGDRAAVDAELATLLG